mmetsp:Transcript_76345/g.182783  ORF Transcript_76345/g.182783 Transcript_76345/m.182783 type:complete len:82 (-) Transcript_76345:417-662(-)
MIIKILLLYFVHPSWKGPLPQYMQTSRPQVSEICWNKQEKKLQPRPGSIHPTQTKVKAWTCFPNPSSSSWHFLWVWKHREA